MFGSRQDLHRLIASNDPLPPCLLPAGDDAFAAAVALPVHGRLHDLLIYWQSKSADGGVPSRGAIDPIEIPRLLTNVVLYDVIEHPARDFRCRLVGAMIRSMDEANVVGRHLSAMVPDETVAPHVWSHYFAAAQGQVMLRIDNLAWIDQASPQYLRYAILLLPLSNPAGEIDQLLGYIHYYGPGEYAALREPLAGFTRAYV